MNMHVNMHVYTHVACMIVHIHRAELIVVNLTLAIVLPLPVCG